ncbi:hypothetical protein GCM10017687_00110 [Streptomyces echinatus]
MVGGEGADLDHPSRSHGAEGDADVRHRPEIGPELLWPGASVVPDERAAGGCSGRFRSGRRADHEDERPEAVGQYEAGRGQCLDEEGARVDTACAASVRQMTDGDPEGQREETGDAEPDPHLVRRKMDRLGEIEDSRGQVETAADGVDEVRGREDALWSWGRQQAGHDRLQVTAGR